MTMGQKCPHCGRRTYQSAGSYRECSSCGYLGWPWSQGVAEVGQGPGDRCPWCRKLTLHDVKTRDDGSVLRRCSTCNYTAIEPAG